MALRPALQFFAEEMEKELKKNDFRGTWKDENPELMMAKLWDELYDLDDRVEELLDGNPDRMAILKEAVDVANYAFFVADICLASTKEDTK